MALSGKIGINKLNEPSIEIYRHFYIQLVFVSEKYNFSPIIIYIFKVGSLKY